MRERSTWDRNEIVRNASFGRRAEDPRAMNQDHLQQQPAADAYVTGGPSEFAEDVHPSAGTWKAEYAGGEVSRNEIGMPEMRKDTFNHPEKTASMDDETILKKADLCTKVARRMLPKNASDAQVEDQALALMDMQDGPLIDTANRLAAVVADDDEEQGQGQGQEQGQDKQAKKSDDQEPKQGQQDPKDAKQGQQDPKDAKDAKQGKQGGQVPPQFKEQIEKKKEEAKDKDGDKDKDKGQQKQGAGAMFIAALKSGNGEGVEQALATMLSQAIQQMGQGQQQQKDAIIGIADQMPQQGAVYGQGQNQQPMAQGQNQQPMAQGQNQQPMAQGQNGQQQPMAQGQNQQPMGQQQQMSDDQLLDQMLQDDLGQPQMMMGMGGYGAGSGVAANGPDIQLEANTMDVGEVQLDAGDEVLNTLFASNPEYQHAAEAHALQNGGQRPMTASQPMTRTAATRTVGTRPTAGVTQIGGAPGASGGGEVDKLSGLWQSAPDVSNVFR